VKSRERATPGRTVALVPAGGSGTRMRSRVPKQYLSLGGIPVLALTLRALAGSRSVDAIVVAAPGDRLEATRRLLRRYRIAKPVIVVEGGSTRQESVRCGLEAAPASARLVVVHDGVRPFVTPDLLERVLRAARQRGAATCGVPVRETVKRVRDGLVSSTVDRDGLWLVQTPQAFRRDLLREAHDKARRDGVVATDDATLVERLGVAVAMVPAPGHNLKITTPEDLVTARRWVRRPPRRRS
jgi:2-C-methyl-D-erythritol 4-phosphate cytidylyltransferase